VQEKIYSGSQTNYIKPWMSLPLHIHFIMDREVSICNLLEDERVQFRVPIPAKIYFSKLLQERMDEEGISAM
jgi:hypothetical protein